MSKKYLFGLMILSIVFASLVSFAYAKGGDVRVMVVATIQYPSQNAWYDYEVPYFNITISDFVEFPNYCNYTLNNFSEEFDCSLTSINITASENYNRLVVFVSNNDTGEEAKPVRIFYIDTISPDITITSPLAQNYPDKVDTIDYTLIETNPNTCWFNDGTTNTTFNCSLGTITFPEVPESPEGENTWTICANDTVGHQDCDSVTFFVDSIFPQVIYNDGTSLSGNYSQDWVLINITCSDTNINNVMLNWNGVDESFDSNDGDVYWTRKEGLVDGVYDFYAWCDDIVSHVNQTETRSVLLDTNSPVITLNSPNNNQPFAFDDNDISFSYNVTDFFPSVTCNLYIDSILNQTMFSDTTSNPNIFVVDDFTNGKYEWYIECQDSLSNSAASETRTFTVLSNLTFPPGTEYPDLPSEPDISNVWFWIKNEFGIINWTVQLDLSRGLNWADYITLTFNHAEVDGINAYELNNQATITLFNLTWTTPQILKNGVLCSNCIMNSYENGTINFDVTSFSVYETQEKPVPPTSGSSGGTSCRTNEWICSDWSECLQGTQVRTCELEKSWCENKTVMPVETQDCIIPVIENETAEIIEQVEEIPSEKGKGFLSGITGFVTANMAPTGLTIGVITAITLGYLIMNYRSKKADEKIKEEISKQSGIKLVSKEKK